MNLKRSIIIIGVVAMAAAVVAYGIVSRRVNEGDSAGGRARHAFVDRDTKKTVYLYFTVKGGCDLASEERVVSDPGDTAGLARSIVDALIEGPRSGDLVRTIPEGTVCKALYIRDNRIAYVDFSADIRESHPGGSRTELMTIYSIVNSLVLNVDDIERVKILIAGQDSDVLAGHIDIRFAFKADMRMIQ
ncbi:MAG: GerMN domain-containing protein [Thermodesulfobacteriota bacterium]|nr:GerMN domain-containing protein [Thermodesulfobacteriota bacterium]